MNPLSKKQQVWNAILIRLFASGFLLYISWRIYAGMEENTAVPKPVFWLAILAFSGLAVVYAALVLRNAKAALAAAKEEDEALLREQQKAPAAGPDSAEDEDVHDPLGLFEPKDPE